MIKSGTCHSQKWLSLELGTPKLTKVLDSAIFWEWQVLDLFISGGGKFIFFCPHRENWGWQEGWNTLYSAVQYMYCVVHTEKCPVNCWVLIVQCAVYSVLVQPLTPGADVIERCPYTSGHCTPHTQNCTIYTAHWTLHISYFPVYTATLKLYTEYAEYL